ncbi:hypothetical protein VIGAN_06031400 [Vigna angularis var. angularis]|uniref:Uncharacterized protein n=1 Tax=Vigna angularis var. angularis TaxID=157739 RepID=A0A0S3S9A3_PHAAN|nr:hypothetical protein VIGAN_06031400 [Vigna angularis var. angularis]
MSTFPRIQMQKSYLRRNQHLFFPSNQGHQLSTLSEMSKVQGKATIGNVYSYSRLRTPHSIENYLITNGEIVCHHSHRLTSASNV